LLIELPVYLLVRRHSPWSIAAFATDPIGGRGKLVLYTIRGIAKDPALQDMTTS
jgi:hypothetical protein